MPIKLESQGNTGPIFFVILVVVVVVGFVVIGFVDFCPEGFVRHCVHAVSGPFSDFACECVPNSTVP